jgi:DNA invertase Pin-like site-specific DNA recombinase
MLIGYMRVSRSDGSQKLDLQKDGLLAAGVLEENIYSDMASGSRDDRIGAENCMRALRKDDILVVYALDRIARSVKHSAVIAEHLIERGIGLKVISGAGAMVDVTTPAGRFYYDMLAAVAQLDREFTRLRTKDGLAAARARGRFGGRRRKVTKQVLQVIQLAIKDPNTSIKDLANQFNVSKFTIYYYVYANGELTESGKQLMGEE